MTGVPPTKSIPRRDFVILPLISLLTVLLMIGLAEFASRQIWPERLQDDCQYVSKISGERRRPNCVMFMKNVEGPWIRYQTNECGYRGTAWCGAKRHGTIRVVIMGTSAAFGLHVAEDKYFADRAAPELAQMWHHPVEFENMGDFGGEWSKDDSILKEMISLEPDAVFYVVVPFDLNRMDHLESEVKMKPEGEHTAEKAAWNWTDVRVLLRESRFFSVAQHFMLKDQTFFLHAFEKYADPFDVSRVPTPPLVEERFRRMDMFVGKLVNYAAEAGVPCYMIALPNRVEAAMISKNMIEPQMDAYVFPRRMKEIAEKHQVGYIDMVPALRKTRDAEDLFYSVDGHPNARAHELMARSVIEYFEKRGTRCDRERYAPTSFTHTFLTSAHTRGEASAGDARVMH